MFFHHLMSIWAVSTLWLLWIMLVATRMYKYLLASLCSILLGLYLEVELLEHMVISYLNSSFASLIDRYLLYNVVLVSVQQCESAICVYTCSSLLPPPTPPLGRCHRPSSHWLLPAHEVRLLSFPPSLARPLISLWTLEALQGCSSALPPSRPVHSPSPSSAPRRRRLTHCVCLCPLLSSPGSVRSPSSPACLTRLRCFKSTFFFNIYWPGIEPRPPHWECGVLATGPPGKSQEHIQFNRFKTGLLPWKALSQ